MTRIVIAMVALIMLDFSNPITRLGKHTTDKQKRILNFIGSLLVCYLAVTHF